MSDFLKVDIAQELALSTVEVGNVFRIPMDISNGIIPKSGDAARNKFFVVLGFDSAGNVYGGVIFNSNINQNIPNEIRQLHMPVKQSKYPFLDHNSFVDCSRLKTANYQKLLSGKFLGVIDNDDLNLIIGTLRESPVETPAHLALFGL